MTTPPIVTVTARPVTARAVRWDGTPEAFAALGDLAGLCRRWWLEPDQAPDSAATEAWLAEDDDGAARVAAAVRRVWDDGAQVARLQVRTPSGQAWVEAGDWLLVDSAGWLYPCAPSVFTARWQPAGGPITADGRPVIDPDGTPLLLLPRVPRNADRFTAAIEDARRMLAPAPSDQALDNIRATIAEMADGGPVPTEPAHPDARGIRVDPGDTLEPARARPRAAEVWRACAARFGIVPKGADR